MGYSPEYLAYINSRKWKTRSKEIRLINGNRCILFPWLKSNETHHMTYRNLKKELLIRDVVPLSRFAHKLIHSKIFWKTGLRPWVNYYLRFCTVISIIFWGFIHKILQLKYK